LAVMGYVEPSADFDAAVSELRQTVRDATRAATTFGYGPRFLHSTGQLHKGGPNTGVFIQLVGHPSERKLPIPGQSFDFGALVWAQALGDFKSLHEHGRRVVRIDLGNDIDAGLAALRRT